MKLSIDLSLYPILHIPLLIILLLLFSIHLYSKTNIKSYLNLSFGFSIATLISLFLYTYLNESRIFFWDKPFHLAGILVLIVILTIKLFEEKQKEFLIQLPFYLLLVITMLSFFLPALFSGILFSLSFIGYGLFLLFKTRNGSIEGEGIRSVFFIIIGLFSFIGQWLPFNSGKFLFSLFMLLFMVYECIRYFERIVSLIRSAGINSITDPLTGLFNKGFLYRKAEQLIKKQELSIIFIDIDNFKQLNDIKGHDVGDIVLKDVATLLQNVLKNNGLGIRFGGEELLGIVTNGDPVHLAEKFRAQVEKQAGVTVSIGVATGTKDSKALIKLADKRMYMAKNSGKNKVVFEGE
ncbi:GGDEF domain-containing protein [Psychrobacillus sp. FSL K6-2684]|uniref:GGDEF domain-containing protein n=1 Tax=unclassified Psychrobacillus TaxID=2636677 RepID=UPI0030F9E8C8